MIVGREYSTIELAEAQLSAAINFYLAGDYVPALALAGAAESLFGGPLFPEDRRRDPDAKMLDAEGQAFSMLDRAFRNRMLESRQRVGPGAHPRTAEVEARHGEYLSRNSNDALLTDSLQARAHWSQPFPRSGDLWNRRQKLRG
jgi:hypothetical protein